MLFFRTISHNRLGTIIGIAYFTYAYIGQHPRSSFSVECNRGRHYFELDHPYCTQLFESLPNILHVFQETVLAGFALFLLASLKIIHAYVFSGDYNEYNIVVYALTVAITVAVLGYVHAYLGALIQQWIMQIKQMKKNH